MNLKVFCSLLLLILVSAGCRVESTDEIKAAYFPIADYIEVIAEELVGKTLIKEVRVNGKNERMTTQPTFEEWLQELDFFLKADINTASLANSYETTKQGDILTHELKPGERNKVKKIVVKYRNENIQEITFLIETTNPFYTSMTKGVLIHHGETGKVDQYAIENVQDVLFAKPNHLSIFGSIQ